ncbi:MULTISPECIES: hypothetical protein [Aurantimonas]|uniref:hypothetical protein n=1 Tax=Aurantimonas TaxID=182269 RepID=UPI003515D445
MILELIEASHSTEADFLSSLNVIDLADVAWPLPNAEAVSPADYWSAYIAGSHKALAEIGLRMVDGRACKVFATFDPKQRGGVAMAIEVGTREPHFFTWTNCNHHYDARHDRLMSVYQCERCGHSYNISAEG